MTKAVEHQEDERRAELEMSYNYWKKMRVKLNVHLNKETRAMNICYRRHKKLMNERALIISEKAPFYSANTFRLLWNMQNIERVKDELNRHRAIVKTLREQVKVAIDQGNDVLDEMDILIW